MQIGPDLHALSRAIDGRALTPELFDRVDRLAEQLEALAVLDEPSESGLPLVAIWLALARLYAHRGLVEGEPPGSIEEQVFTHGNRAARLAAIMIAQRRYSAGLARRVGT